MKRVLLLMLSVAMMLTAMSGLAVSAEAPALTDFDLNREELTLIPEQTYKLKLQILPAAADVADTAWVSSDTAVATVDGGKVTAVSVGKTTVTATAPDGKTADCVVTVLPAPAASEADLTVETITWNGDGQVKPNTKLTIAVTVKNEGAADVTAPFTVDVAFGQEALFTLKHEGGVKAGESVTLTAEPWTAVSGDRMVSAYVNADFAVGETEYRNNTYQRGLRVADDRIRPAYDAIDAAVAEAGMFDLSFNEDFDDLSGWDTMASGLAGYKWYVARQWAQSDMTREDYFVKDGVLTLQHEDSTYAIGASTVDPKTRNGYVYNKGYLEYKIRITRPEKNPDADGKPAAVWSLPIGKWCEISGQNKHWVEMDWLEYYGDSYYTITMHEQEKTENGENWYKSTNNNFYGLDDKEWHIMGFLWEEGRLRCYLDGEMIREQTWGPEDVPIPASSVESGEFRMDGVFSIMDEQETLLFIAADRDYPLEMDYIRVWQLGGSDAVSEPVTAPAPETTPKTGWIVGAAVVALLLIGGAVVFLVKKCK